MRIHQFILAIAVIAMVASIGCNTSLPSDEPIKLALEAQLQTEEFTQEERDAVENITVHNNIAKVWLKKDFSQDQKMISTMSEHFAMKFAKTFYDKALELKYREPQYRVYVYMKYTTPDGVITVNPCDVNYDMQKASPKLEKHGFGQIKEIR